MRQAALYSAALHISVIALAYFGIPALLSSPPLEDQPVSVDLVSADDLPPPPKLPEPPRAKPVPPPPAPATAPTPPPPPVAESAPEPPPPPEAKPEPPPPPPEPKPVAKPKPKPKPPEVKPAPKPPVKEARPVPRPKRKPRHEDQFQALLKNLAKQKEAQQRVSKPAPNAKSEPVPVPATRQVARAAIDRRASERKLIAMVKQQLAGCWNIPAGAKDAQNMRVGIQIRLNPDGTLRGSPNVLDSKRMRSDQVFRTVAESAVRALRNPHCSPLKLPYEQYDIWQDITFNFDPGEALGQ